MSPSDVVLAAAVGVLFSAGVLAQQRDFDKVEIRSEKLAENVYMLAGAGGNMGFPGHAPVVDRAEVEAFRAMLVAVRQRVADAIARGDTQEEVLASQPTKEFDARYGNGVIKPDVFVQRVYIDLKRSSKPEG